MSTEVISLHCYVCTNPIDWRIDLIEETIDAQVGAVARLAVDEQTRYVAQLHLKNADAAVYERLPDGGVAVCKECHAIGMVAATRRIESSEGLLEWTWRYLNDTLYGMLESHPGRGFSGDDGFDDYKGVIAMLHTLSGIYFDGSAPASLVEFGEFLSEGPQYAEDPRRELFAVAGIDADD